MINHEPLPPTIFNSVRDITRIEAGSSQGGYSFTGREWDTDTQLYYYRARYYYPVSARFISEDPSGFAAGSNFYAYVGNIPVNLIDPSGVRRAI